jgi:hypothetical protein
MYGSSPLVRLRRTVGNLVISVVAVAVSFAVATVLFSHPRVTPATTGMISRSSSSTSTHSPTSRNSTLTPSKSPPVSAISFVKPVVGVVTNLTSSSITIRRSTGAMDSYAVNSSTAVLEGRLRTRLSKLKVGTFVYVVSSSTNPHLAVAVGIMTARGDDSFDGASSDN